MAVGPPDIPFAKEARHDTINVRDKARADADAIVTYIRGRISAGAWKQSTKLPTERDLAQQFAAGRHTVRNALQTLEAEGAIVRQVGRGTFVSAGGDAVSPAQVAPPLALLGMDLDASPADILQCRLIFEPGMADLVVAHASKADFDVMEDCLRQGDAAGDWQVFEHWDDQLHQAIAKATRNDVILKISSALARVRQQGEWGRLKQRSLTDDRRKEIQAQHREIVRALRERDAEGAAAALRGHILHVRSYMLGA